ncbi:hypothetical protein, partial [Streptococcus suis]|uniref:hypothetical protein n=1 Tax=Streptococcus suis TaxID=1307 RepID=UPI001F161219
LGFLVCPPFAFPPVLFLGVNSLTLTLLYHHFGDLSTLFLRKTQKCFLFGDFFVILHLITKE